MFAIFSISFQHKILFSVQKPVEFGTGDKEFSAQGSARFQFPALDEAIDAEIIQAQHISRLWNGLCQPFHSLFFSQLFRDLIGFAVIHKNLVCFTSFCFGQLL
jgi:hypothetical protein